MMFDLTEINKVAKILEDTKGLKKEKVFEAIADALAAAYKKEYGERGEIIRANFNNETGEVEYYQVKLVLDKEDVITDEDVEKMTKEEYLRKKDEGKTRFIPERHIMIESAKMIKSDIAVGEEISFPLELKGDFSRVSAQAAKQAILRAIKDAEKQHLTEKFGHLENTIVYGSVLDVENGNMRVQLDGLEAIMPYSEQIKKETYKTGDKIKAVLVSAESEGNGVSLKLSRTHPEFLKQLFYQEVPEIRNGQIEIKNIVRDPGFRSKISVISHDDDIDPIGALVGQSGSRVNAIMSELSGERIDIIEWSENLTEFIEDALSPAEVISVEQIGVKEVNVIVSNSQYSLAIGKSGQNVRLAARLVAAKINIIKENEDNSKTDKENKSDIEKKNK